LSAVCYSVFALVPFGTLVVADVLMYAVALGLEFGALVALRKKEPELRGSFRIPLGRGGVALLAMVPATILLVVVGFSFMDGEYGLPSLVGSAVGLGLGPVFFLIADRARKRAGRREA
jgi:amino acid transporter